LYLLLIDSGFDNLGFSYVITVDYIVIDIYLNKASPVVIVVGGLRLTLSLPTTLWRYHYAGVTNYVGDLGWRGLRRVRL
jgi:hypothetical protein